jgi:hypothetical protein
MLFCKKKILCYSVHVASFLTVDPIYPTLTRDELG